MKMSQQLLCKLCKKVLTDITCIAVFRGILASPPQDGISVTKLLQKEAFSGDIQKLRDQVALENKLPQESNSQGSRPQNGQREEEEENAMVIDDNSDDEEEKDSRMKVSDDVSSEVDNLLRMFHSCEVLESENENAIFEAMAKSPVFAEASAKKSRMLGHSGFEFKFEVGFQL